MESTAEPRVPLPHSRLCGCCHHVFKGHGVTINGPTVTHCYHPKSMCHVRLTLAVVLALDK